MKLAIGIASFVGGLIICYLLFSLGVVQRLGGVPTVPNDAPQSISIYLSFVSVMLTAATVVLTALGIGIGIVAAYTFSGLKSEARLIAQSTAKDVSESTSRDVASDALSELRVKSIIEEYFAIYVKQKEQEKEWGSEPDGAEER